MPKTRGKRNIVDCCERVTPPTSKMTIHTDEGWVFVCPSCYYDEYQEREEPYESG